MASSIQSRIQQAKFIIWIFAFIPVLRLFYLALSDGLGANPVEFIERSTGTWALVFLMFTLSITPIHLVFKQAWTLALRRLLGLWMFFYACLHLTTYLWLDYSFVWADIYKDIIKHPYVLVGAGALLLTSSLAITSNQIALRLLKKRWKTLHRIIYLIAILALLHFWWLVKKDVTEPVVYTIVFCMLMLLRWRNLSQSFKEK